VIVEPISGSAGVILPPVGYLKRLREICDKHDILLIFDEVITGFGRTGKAFAAQSFDVTADLMTTAKGLTNGAVPMGAVFAQRKIYYALMQGPEGAIELFHGYTYSAHPVACAGRVGDARHLHERGIADACRNTRSEMGGGGAFPARHEACDRRSHYGLIGAVELEPRAGKPGARAFDVFLECFERGVMVRQTGDVIAMVAAAHHRREADHPHRRNPNRGDSRHGLTGGGAAGHSSIVGRCRLEHRIPLLAGFDDLPSSFEAGGHDERVAGAELVSLAADRFDAHATLEQHQRQVADTL